MILNKNSHILYIFLNKNNTILYNFLNKINHIYKIIYKKTSTLYSYLKFSRELKKKFEVPCPQMG